MNRSKVFSGPLAVILILLAILIAIPAQAVEPIVVDKTVSRTVIVNDLVRTVDNFIILFQSSSSMAEPYGNTGMTKIEAAKKLLKEKIGMMPDLDWQAGLYLYTPFQALYPMQDFDPAAYAAAIDQLPTEATESTPLVKGLQNLDGILAELQGPTAVFLFWNGVYNSFPTTRERPFTLARELSEKYDVCFYLISSAVEKTGRDTLKKMSNNMSCSQIAPIEAMLGRAGYLYGSLFVIDQRAIELIANIEKVVGYDLGTLNFGFDSAAINPEDHVRIDKLGQYLQTNPDKYVIIAGYTDSTGDWEYNQRLSMHRAFAAGGYLLDRFKLGADQIILRWYGPMDPVATNDTVEGRRLNRRVEGILLGF